MACTIFMAIFKSKEGSELHEHGPMVGDNTTLQQRKYNNNRKIKRIAMVEIIKRAQKTMSSK